MQPAAIMEIFVAVITGLVKGVTTALVDGFEVLFIAEEGGLTTFAIWAIIGAAISFAIALQRGVFRKAKISA